MKRTLATALALALALAACLAAGCGARGPQGEDAATLEVSDKAAPAPCAVHEVASWTVVREAGCSEPGLREGVCTVCGRQVSEEIPPTGAHAEGWWEYADAGGGVEGTLFCAECGQPMGSTFEEYSAPLPNYREGDYHGEVLVKARVRMIEPDGVFMRLENEDFSTRSFTCQSSSKTGPLYWIEGAEYVVVRGKVSVALQGTNIYDTEILCVTWPEE